MMINADVMMHACMMTLKGIPVIYSGDEIGLQNDYNYHEDPGKQADSRNIHRGKFDWELAELRHDESSVTGRVFNEIRRLVNIRKSNEVFHSDAKLYPVDTGENRVLGIMREYGENRMFGLFNFSAEHCVTHSPSEEQLEPYGFKWIFLSKDR